MLWSWLFAFGRWSGSRFDRAYRSASWEIIEHATAMIPALLLGAVSLARAIDGRVLYAISALFCAVLFVSFSLGAGLWWAALRETRAVVRAMGAQPAALWAHDARSPGAPLMRASAALILISCVAQLCAVTQLQSPSFVVLLFSGALAILALFVGFAWCAALVANAAQRVCAGSHALLYDASPSDGGAFCCALFTQQPLLAGAAQAWLEAPKTHALSAMLELRLLERVGALGYGLVLRVADPRRVEWALHSQPELDLVLVLAPGQTARFRLPFGLDAFRPRALSKW